MQHIVRGPFESKSFENDLPVHILRYIYDQSNSKHKAFEIAYVDTYHMYT